MQRQRPLHLKIHCLCLDQKERHQSCINNVDNCRRCLFLPKDKQTKRGVYFCNLVGCLFPAYKFLCHFFKRGVLWFDVFKQYFQLWVVPLKTWQDGSWWCFVPNPDLVEGTCSRFRNVVSSIAVTWTDTRIYNRFIWFKGHCSFSLVPFWIGF